MKIQRKVNNLLKSKDIGLWNPCYFMNSKDAKLTWEEKKALLHIFEIIVEKASPLANISSGIQFDEDIPGEVGYFCLNYGVRTDIGYDSDFIYIFNYYGGYTDEYYVENLSKRYGAHWGSFKAGLRSWYDYLLNTGKETRKPTNYKSVVA